MEIISSSQNSFVKKVKGLYLKKNRDKLGVFLIDGLRFVEEAIKAKASIKNLIMAKSFFEKYRQEPDHYESVFLQEYLEQSMDLDRDEGGIVVLEDILQKSISDTQQSQGIMAIIEKSFDSIDKSHDLLKNSSFVVVLDKLQNPGNVGTIIRTAHAAGANAVILSDGCVDIYNPKTLRATMGSIFHIPVILGGNSKSIILSLKDNGYKTIAAHLKGSKSMFETDYSGKVAIVIGNEGNGISDDVTELCDHLVRIPMPGGAESLNASVAAGLLIYERARRNF